MLPQSYHFVAAMVLIGGGILACFAGYRMFRPVLALYGFILGAMVASSAMAASDATGMIVAAAIGGVAGALLFFFAYYAGIALIGAALGAGLAHIVWLRLGGDPPVLVVIACSIVGALAAMALQRHVVIATTAVAGGWTMIAGLMALVADRSGRAAAGVSDVWILYPLDPAPGRRWVVPAWILLSLAGLVVQLGHKTKRKRAGTPAKAS